MKHARPDYNRIQDPAGLIPENEPVFLIRGQDIFGATAVRLYAALAEEGGADPELVASAKAHAKLMEEWSVQKMPDLPTEQT